MGLTVISPVFNIQVILDFGHESTPGEQDWAQTTVSAPWVTAASILTASYSPMPNLNHDGGDWVYEGLSVTIQNIVPGVSFDVYGYAPLNTWGKFLVNVSGV
jgi:hypothetical protein